MIKWDSLFQSEKQVYLDRAKQYLQRGQYQGFDVEELAIFIYESERKGLS
jgi:hypothetical protein